jgi:hypothetical protein
MFCPRCGNTSSTSQKFCRSCGLELEQVSQMLGPATDSLVETKPTTADKLRRSGSIAVIATIELALAAVCVMIVRGMVIDGGVPFIFGLLGLIVVLGMSAGFTLLALAQMKQNEAKKLANKSSSLTGPQTSQLSPGLNHAELPPSVTDRTTELLEPHHEA